MTMTREQLETLAASLEEQADHHPGLYRLKLLGFAALGYVYLYGVPLLLTLAAVGLGVAVAALGDAVAVAKIAIPALVLTGVVLVAARVRLNPPTGLQMKPAERRRLFATIEEVREAAKAPPVHAVLLTNSLDAAIVQVPRLGLLGWPENYLLLGLPLMELLTPVEFKAVLAHELAHVSGAHGRFGAWIYRIRQSWTRSNEQLQQKKQPASLLFAPFFGWFAPRFAAWSFAQARQQEYEADSIAAEATGAAPLANALIRLDLKRRELREVFWPSVYAKTADQAAPSAAPFSRLAGREQRGFVPAAPEHLKQALRRATDNADTHPCLSERLSAIRQPARLPQPVEQSAAEALFGGALPFIADHFDNEWRAAIAPWWSERHAQITNSRERFAALSKRAPAQLSDDELFTLARLSEELEGPERAYPLYLALAKRPSRPLGARFAVGRLLLQKGDDRGKHVIDRIIAENPDTVMAGCEVVVRYLRSRGREQEAKAYVGRYWQMRNTKAQPDQGNEARRAS